MPEKLERDTAKPRKPKSYIELVLGCLVTRFEPGTTSPEYYRYTTLFGFPHHNASGRQIQLRTYDLKDRKRHLYRRENLRSQITHLSGCRRLMLHCVSTRNFGTEGRLLKLWLSDLCELRVLSMRYAVYLFVHPLASRLILHVQFPNLFTLIENFWKCILLTNDSQVNSQWFPNYIHR